MLLPASVFAVQNSPVQLLYGKYAPGSEVVELRAENSKTTWLGGKQYSVAISAGAIHYKDNYADKNEQWKDIDLTWQNNQITRAPYTLTVDPDTYSLLMYDKRTGSTVILHLYDIGNKPVAKALSGSANIKRGVSSLFNVATDMDIEIVADNTKVQFKRILKSDKAPADATFNISQSGTGITVTSAARYADNKGMLDAKIPVIASRSGSILTETIDKAKITKYPIEIDPTLTIQPSGKDNYLMNYDPANNQGNEINLAVEGSTTATLRSLVEFSIAGIPAGVTITTATLNLYYYGAGIGTPAGRTYNCYRVLRRDWVELESTWNIYKAASNWTTAGCSNDGADYTSVAGATAVIPAIGNWAVWNVLNQVQTAYAGGFTADFRISDSVEGIVPRHMALFFSNDYALDTSLRPKLVVYYAVLSTITTNAANNLTMSTARLQSYLTNDGGDPCQVRFGWGTVDQGINIAAYNGAGSPSAYAGSYTTGTSPYLDITGLSASTTYYFNVEALNVIGSSYGTSRPFITPAFAVGNPSNATAIPSYDSVVLSWTKGANATKTHIRFMANACPTDNVTGTFLWCDIASTYTHTGLTSGTDYCYWIAGYEDAYGFSPSSITIHATTLATGASANITGVATLRPAEMTQPPSITPALEGGAPIFPFIRSASTSTGIPFSNFAYILVLFILCGLSYAIYKWTHSIEAIVFIWVFVNWVCLPTLHTPLIVPLFVSAVGIGYGIYRIRTVI